MNIIIQKLRPFRLKVSRVLEKLIRFDWAVVLDMDYDDAVDAVEAVEAVEAAKKLKN